MTDLWSQQELERLLAVARARPAGETFAERLGPLVKALRGLFPRVNRILLSLLDTATLHPTSVGGARVRPVGDRFGVVGRCMLLDDYPLAMAEEYLTHYAMHDPSAPLLVANAGRMSSPNTLLREAGLPPVDEDPVMRPFLERWNVADAIGAFAPLPGERAALQLGLMLPLGCAATERELEQGELILPDLLGIVGAALAFERAAEAAARAAETPVRLGAVVFDAEGALEQVDTGAEVLLGDAGLTELSAWARGLAPPACEVRVLPCAEPTGPGWVQQHLSLFPWGGVATLEVLQPGSLEHAEGVCAHFGLSPRQREVGLQACEGRSNQEIAASLGLSPETVKTFLSQVYARTGADGRGKLAALVLGQPG